MIRRKKGEGRREKGEERRIKKNQGKKTTCKEMYNHVLYGLANGVDVVRQGIKQCHVFTWITYWTLFTIEV